MTMAAAGHEHEWIWSGSNDCRCACGADMWPIENALSAAADDARSVAGEAHFTGCRLRQESESLDLWLFDAPPQVLRELEALHPGVYAIHDAPRSRATVDELRDSFDWPAWKAAGMKVVVVGPTEDGCLQVGVEDRVEAAQAELDAVYGENVVRVSRQGPVVAC